MAVAGETLSLVARHGVTLLADGAWARPNGTTPHKVAGALLANGSSVPEDVMHQSGDASAADLASSLFINACVLLVGVGLWYLLRLCRLGRAFSPRGDDLLDSRPWVRSTAVRNYICFLQHCRDMFVVLTLISALATVPHWGISPIALGVPGGAVSTTQGLDAPGLTILCCETLLRGLFALAFVERLQRRIKKPLLGRRERDSIQRTLWLSDLPVYDHETNQPFLFHDEDFCRVAEDLETAINQELRRSTLGLFTAAEMHVQVAPVVDEWYAVSLSLRNAQEHLEVLRSSMQVHRRGWWGALVMRWYGRRNRLCAAEVARLQLDLERIVAGPKRISGAAFITFFTSQHRDHFLKNKPRCWQFRDHAYFSFGRPPFASATLACMRAPHPSDVNWMNLHVTRWEQRVRFFTLTTLLLIAMVVLVTPVTISSQLKAIIPTVERHVDAVARWFDCENAVEVLSSRSAEFAYNQLPAIILVVINSLLLPDCISRISTAVKPHRHSSSEVIQLHLNFAFLVLTAIIIPFLGLQSIDGLVAAAKMRISHHPSLLVPRISRVVLRRLMHSPGIFALRYILNCACLTNTNSLLQIPQLVYRAYARRVATTPRESVEAEKVWVFAWGYWYAWTISIFTIGICMSSAVPSTLPCAALFFSLQHAVDRYNLMHRIYSHGPDIESENLLATRVLHYMRCVIAVWWCLMACGFLLSARHLPARSWEAGVPLWCVEATAGLLMVLSVALVIFSFWSHQSILHDNQFHNVDMAERGLSSTGGPFQGLFSNIDSILRCAWCVGGKGNYSVVGGADMLERFDSVTTDGGFHGGTDMATLPGFAQLGSFPGNAEAGDAELEGLRGGESSSAEGIIGSSLSWDARSVVLRPVTHCGPL